MRPETIQIPGFRARISIGRTPGGAPSVRLGSEDLTPEQALALAAQLVRFADEAAALPANP